MSTENPQTTSNLPNGHGRRGPIVFPLYILHCFGRQNTTKTIPLEDKGHTDFMLAETHKAQHPYAPTLSYLCQQELMQFLPPRKKQFLQNVKTTRHWSKHLQSTLSDVLEEKHWGRYSNLFRKCNSHPCPSPYSPFLSPSPKMTVLPKKRDHKYLISFKYTAHTSTFIPSRENGHFTDIKECCKRRTTITRSLD